MREAGTIPDRQLAQRFAAYLLTLGITGRVDQEDRGWVVWVHDDREWQRSRDELATFLADPEAARYRDAQRQAQQLRRDQDLKQQRGARNVVDVRRRWQSWTQGQFPLTLALIAISVVLTLATNFGKSAVVAEWLYIVPILDWRPALGLDAIWQGQVWRLITPIFMHADWLHLIFNMYWTYQFGALIETRRGSLRLLGLTLATAVCSNLAEYVYMVRFQHQFPLFLGMSGVGFGMFGYIWMKSRFDPIASIQIEGSLVFLFLAWLVLCMTGLIGHVANTAHAFGLLSGMAIGYAPVLWRKLRPG